MHSWNLIGFREQLADRKQRGVEVECVESSSVAFALYLGEILGRIRAQAVHGIRAYLSYKRGSHQSLKLTR